MVFMWILASLMILFVLALLIFFGVKWCLEGNAWGVLLLFLGLNVFGLVIGIILLYNQNNKKVTDDSNESDSERTE